MKRLTLTSVLSVPSIGGSVRVEGPEGDFVMDMALSAGRYTGNRLLSSVPRGCALYASEGCSVFDPVQRLDAEFGELHDETAMIEGFQPSQAVLLSRMIDDRLRFAEVRKIREEARERAVSAVSGNVASVEQIEESASVDDTSGTVENGETKVADV